MSLWFTSLSDDERRGLVLLQIWENERQRVFGGWKRAAVFDEQITSSVSFKQAVTVAKWLGEKGFAVQVGQVNWQAYVAFAVAEFQRRQQTPILAQIKNPVLLGRFCAGVNQVVEAKPLLDDDALERRYARALSPAIAANVGLLMLLGLRRTKRT